MPRPGPRPYVCERKIWHSERHQPMRGSVIQEIFRLVNENHSSATKKNKEWQEKLPVVVLRAEEIMYSRANSEKEYTDMKNLWQRTNEAIDIIIRRDDSETGKLLQPCIEAALNLGCTPRRNSRSERNSNPICYLTPPNEKDENNTLQGNLIPNMRISNPPYPGIWRRPTTMNVKQLGSDQSQKHIAEKSNSTSNNFPFPPEIDLFPVEKQPAPNSVPVYSHSYVNQSNHNFDGLQQHAGFELFPNSVSYRAESSMMGHQFLTHDNFSFSDYDFSRKINLTDVLDNTSNDKDAMECDLSLRLGPVPTPSPSVGARNSFSFLPQPNGPVISFSNDMSFDQREYLQLDAALRKRKKMVHGPTVDRPFRLLPKLPYSHLAGKMKTARR